MKKEGGKVDPPFAGIILIRYAGIFSATTSTDAAHPGLIFF